MKIVLFSSRYPGNVNRLNISRLINAFPDYEFTYLLVDNRYSFFIGKLRNLVKEIILTLLLQNPGWYSSRRQGEKRIGRHIPREFDRHIRKIFVKSINGIETENVLKDLKPDLIFQCGAGLLKANIFSLPPLGTLNIHHGIAPEIRGISSTFWSMYYGLNEFIGATVHFIDKNLDTGIVIVQRRTELPEYFDYVEAVYQTAIQGAELLPVAIRIVQSSCTIVESEVKSFYFSSVDWSKYRELSKNKYKAPGNISKLKYKYKRKRILMKPSGQAPIL
ncbi:MAG: formyltransferase family protein [Bacteroidales bacterium]|nr:formyltransferase family protein [Bacteroidales bacterium]